MSSARLAGELQAFEDVAMDGIANASRLTMLTKWRVMAYENLFLKRRGGLLKVLALSLFAPARIDVLVNREHGRIIQEHQEKLTAQMATRKAEVDAAQARASIIQPGEGPLPPEVVGMIGRAR